MYFYVEFMVLRTFYAFLPKLCTVYALFCKEIRECDCTPLFLWQGYNAEGLEGS